MSAVPVVAAIAVYAVAAEPSLIDRANVTQLTTLLDRNGSADGPILERAIYTLNQARRHRVYGWDDRALAGYA